MITYNRTCGHIIVDCHRCYEKTTRGKERWHTALGVVVQLTGFVLHRPPSPPTRKLKEKGHITCLVLEKFGCLRSGGTGELLAPSDLAINSRSARVRRCLISTAFREFSAFDVICLFDELENFGEFVVVGCGLSE